MVFIFCPFLLIGADQNADAKAKYLAAEGSYDEGKPGPAIRLLEEAIELLGESNPRIQCLLAKCCVARKDQYDDSRGAHEVERYFVLATKDMENSVDFVEMQKLREHFDTISKEKGFPVKRFDIRNGEFTACGFEWKIGPDEDMTFDDAHYWVKGLGKGWVLPDGVQLSKLLKDGKRLPFHNFKYSVLPLIMIWGKAKDSKEAFAIESMMGWYVEFPRSTRENFRSIAVRSAGQRAKPSGSSKKKGVFNLTNLYN